MKYFDEDLKSFLELKYDLYNRPSFIESDPISIPHQFTKKEDIEIAAFLSASIAWGNRKMIIRNANKMMKVVQNQPYDFIVNASESDFSESLEVKHRTFQGVDFLFFLKSLQNIYKNHGGLQTVFETGFLKTNSVFDAIGYFREIFFEIPSLQRTQKHISDVRKNSAAKRINMYLMWMTRKDKRGVHFGLWDKISTSELMMPLDVHSGNTARSLGLLTRTQNDRKAVEELTSNLRKFDPQDPVKYDFALFGLGVFEKFGRE